MIVSAIIRRTIATATRTRVSISSYHGCSVAGFSGAGWTKNRCFGVGSFFSLTSTVNLSFSSPITVHQKGGAEALGYLLSNFPPPLATRKNKLKNLLSVNLEEILC